MSAYTLGYLVGIVFVVLVAVIIKLVFFKKTADIKGEFDERQLRERGNAYQCGFNAYMIEFAIYIIYSLAGLDVEIPVEPGVLAILALFIPLTFFCVYAVRHDAFVGYNVTGRKMFLLYIIAFLANLIPAVISLFDGSMVENGKLTLHCTNLFVSIMFGGIILALWVKSREDKNDEE